MGKGAQQKQKAPRRIIHFASGETMEEYSTDEEEDEEQVKKELPPPVEPVSCRGGGARGKISKTLPIVHTPYNRSFALQSKLTWGPYFWFYMWRVATSTLSGEFRRGC